MLLAIITYGWSLISRLRPNHLTFLVTTSVFANGMPLEMILISIDLIDLLQMPVINVYLCVDLSNICMLN